MFTQFPSIRLFALFLVIYSLSFLACNKEYLSGTAAVQRVDMTTYKYLQSKTGVFDSLVKLIDRAGIQSLIDSSGQTLLAITNYGVRQYLTNEETDINRVSSDPFTTDSVNIDTFKYKIRNYLFNSIILRDSVTGGGKYYSSKNASDTTTYYVYIGTSTGDVDYYYYFTSVNYLYFRKVYPSSIGSSVQFQTTDIITNTGAIQVLPNSYTLFD